MPNCISRTPKYRKHKASGQAVVTLSGVDHYLGPHGTAASRREYDRLTGEWLAAGRCLPQQAEPNGLTVVELAGAYLRFARGYYRNSPSSMDRVRAVLRILRKWYGTTPAYQFGPLALQAVQQRLAAQGKSRRYCNHLVSGIKRVFRWGASQELLPVTVYQALATVPGLRQGRSEAREPAPSAPVDDSTVDATLPYLPPAVVAMVRIQRLCGCRAGEIVAMRPSDIDRRGDVWKYRPQTHKTAYRGLDRVIHLGPKAQAILLPWLLRGAESHCFSPNESEDKHNAERRANRRSPMTPSQARRRRKRKPKRAPGKRYTVSSYTNAVRRASRKADADAHKQRPDVDAGERIVPHWTPLQLRHASATEVRAKYDLEGAQAVLGHQHARISEVYALRNQSRAEAIMRQIG